MSTKGRWGVRHPGIGILYYDSEEEARIAAGTAAEFLGRRPAPEAAVSATEEAPETTVEGVLQLIVEEYYEGCKRYATASRPDSPERVFWRIRLGALGKYGSLLAVALGQAEPDWEAIRDIAVVADSLPEIRRRHGVSQMDVANLLDVSQSTVAQWELGRYRVPDEVRGRWEDVCREAAKLKGRRRQGDA